MVDRRIYYYELQNMLSKISYVISNLGSQKCVCVCVRINQFTSTQCETKQRITIINRSVRFDSIRLVRGYDVVFAPNVEFVQFFLFSLSLPISLSIFVLVAVATFSH